MAAARILTAKGKWRFAADRDAFKEAAREMKAKGRGNVAVALVARSEKECMSAALGTDVKNVFNARDALDFFRAIDGEKSRLGACSR